MSEKGDLHFDDFSEILRMYSAEIEYSEENIESIIDYISEFEL